jgi:hypothetical protein
VVCIVDGFGWPESEMHHGITSLLSEVVSSNLYHHELIFQNECVPSSFDMNMRFNL